LVATGVFALKADLVGRLALTAALGTLLAGCSMGGMFGGGSAPSANTQQLQNATASPKVARFSFWFQPVPMPVFGDSGFLTVLPGRCGSGDSSATSHDGTALSSAGIWSNFGL